MKTMIQEALRKVFNPEFLNRIDDVIVFKPLEKADIHKIIENMADLLFKRIRELGFEVSLSDTAKEFLVDKGFDPKFGARPLRRAIQKYVEDPLAEELLGATHKEGATIRIDADASGEGLTFAWTEAVVTGDE